MLQPQAWPRFQPSEQMVVAPAPAACLEEDVRAALTFTFGVDAEVTEVGGLEAAGVAGSAELEDLKAAEAVDATGVGDLGGPECEVDIGTTTSTSSSSSSSAVRALQ